MKLQNALWNKYGESLDERSLTICSGTDYINVNYQHIVCPDAETAKVSITIKLYPNKDIRNLHLVSFSFRSPLFFLLKFLSYNLHNYYYYSPV